MTPRAKQHAWSDKVAFHRHSDRVCWNCGLIKRTRHERGQSWTEWFRGITEIKSVATPPCEKQPDPTLELATS